MALEVWMLSAMLGTYFLPAIVAWWRGHSNTVPIFVATLFYGWTGIGWIVALIWALQRKTAWPS
jgi:Superinfection immunity protein